MPVFATFPIAGLIITAEALETLHFNVEVSPLVISSGLAVKRSDYGQILRCCTGSSGYPRRGNYYLGSRCIASTWSGCSQCIYCCRRRHHAAFAVERYIAHALSIVIVEALDTDQLSLATSPDEMLSGLAENWLITGSVCCDVPVVSSVSEVFVSGTLVTKQPLNNNNRDTIIRTARNVKRVFVYISTSRMAHLKNYTPVQVRCE